MNLFMIIAFLAFFGAFRSRIKKPSREFMINVFPWIIVLLFGLEVLALSIL